MFKKKQNPKKKIMYYAYLQPPGYVTSIYDSFFTLGLVKYGKDILYPAIYLRTKFFLSFKKDVSIKCCHSKEDIVKKYGDGSYRSGSHGCYIFGGALPRKYFVYKLTVKQNEEEICLDEVEKVKNDIIYTSDVKFTDVTKIEYLDKLGKIHFDLWAAGRLKL